MTHLRKPQPVLISYFVYFVDHYLANLLSLRENISGHQVIFYKVQVHFGDTECIQRMQRLSYEPDLNGLALMAISECFMNCVSCAASLQRDTTWASRMACVNCLSCKHRDVSLVPSTQVKTRHSKRYWDYKSQCWGSIGRFLELSQTSALPELVYSRLNERSQPKIEGEEQLKMIPDANIWPQYTHAYMHACALVCIHSHAGSINCKMMCKNL